jgi:hypothetical protein
LTSVDLRSLRAASAAAPIGMAFVQVDVSSKEVGPG